MAKIEHIERLRPPWRTLRLTECGHDIEEYKQVLSRDAAVAKIKKEGIQRASYGLCMTCLNKIQYNSRDRWEDDPSANMARDAMRRTDLLADELKALAILWENHQEEYVSIVKGLADTSNLSDKRAAKKYMQGV